MSVKPRDFLGTAERLLNASVGEIDDRSSINRAYYAVFSFVKKKTESLVSYTGSGDHDLAFKQVEWRWQDLLDDFASLQDARIEADYHLDNSVSHGRAQHRYKVAVNLFTELQTR